MLEARFGPIWAGWIDAAARLRRRVRGLRLPADQQERVFDAFFHATVDEGALGARVPTEDELEGLIVSPPASAARPAVSAPASAASAAGEGRALVSLVGAGPGDAGLLTVRGRSRLMAADAVVYDRLAAAALPTDLPARVALHAVGKEAGSHPVPQEEINALLVRLARGGARVVRLKGGDPCVFGRGGEEAEALRAAGVPFEIVPGVTAGIAVPAYAGIPVTHRREAARVTFLTAHAASDGGAQARWEHLARDHGTTIVGYMGAASLPSVASRLVAAGLDPATPAALIERGTTSRQRVVRAGIGELPAEAARAGLEAPALLVVGPTVHHADRLGWFAARPLSGERLALVAPAGSVGESLAAAGADVVELPLPVSEAARVVLAALPLTGAVLRSAAEVDALDDERGGAGWSAGAAAWCLTRDAAARARERGWSPVREVEASALVAELTAQRRAR
jgi:uroporphyrin-III C-methyltransferase